MQVLVTGCAGFIGYHLTQSLLAQGHAVVGLDNMATGSRTSLGILSQNPKFYFLEADVAKPLPKMPKLDRIYNFACPASPPHYQRDPVQTWKTSVLGAMNILDLARDQQCVVMQASTSEVYGDPQQHPQNENYVGHVNPIGIRACYDEGKRAAESLFFDYNRSYGVAIKVIRIFNTYGPFMHPDDGRVVSNFINQALRGQPLTVYGNGEQTRSFCYIDDLIDGINKMMESPSDVTGPINLGNPQEFTMLQLLEKVRAMTQSQSPVINNPLPQDDPAKRRPDIARAQKILGWEPKVTLDEGLRRTIDYFSGLHNGADQTGKRAHA